MLVKKITNQGYWNSSYRIYKNHYQNCSILKNSL